MDITLVYFVYGLAFFTMGVAMMLEAGRSPLLAEAQVLIPLAIFGLVHGAHEWLEMFLDKSEWLVFRYPLLVSWMRIIILTLSFTSLVVFGLRMWEPLRRPSGSEVMRWVLGIGVYLFLVFLLSLIAFVEHGDWLAHLDASVRYLVAVPGAILAGLALLRQSTQAKRQARSQLAGSLRWAAIGFLIYACTQIVVPPIDIFPGNTLNTQVFTTFFGFPVQIVRAATAVLITVSLIRSIQAVEQERQRQFLAAQEARLEALEQLRKELLEREALRRELLRHTVIAQEEERARIARELHDETSQVLTAFTLHLAALQDSLPGNGPVRDLINRLQTLSRQMSRGIYRLVHDLRPAQLDDLGLVAALQYLTSEESRRIGLQVTLEVRGARQRLDPLVETVLYRVAQEALTNVVRHAGVQQADVQLFFSPQHVTLRVSDQGKGYDLTKDLSPPRGYGLAGMRERVDSVGGHLELRSILGQGTIVEVSVPLNPIKSASDEVSLALNQSGSPNSGK